MIVLIVKKGNDEKISEMLINLWLDEKFTGKTEDEMGIIFGDDLVDEVNVGMITCRPK